MALGLQKSDERQGRRSVNGPKLMISIAIGIVLFAAFIYVAPVLFEGSMAHPDHTWRGLPYWNISSGFERFLYAGILLVLCAFVARASLKWKRSKNEINRNE